MKPKSKLLLQSVLVTVAIILAGCATQVAVQTDYDHSAAFGHYRTYAFDASAARLGPTNTAAMESALRSGLAARGLKETSASNADLIVIPAVRLGQRIDVIPSGNFAYFPSHYGAYGYWDRYRMPADVMQYTEGTLVLDFVDRKNHKLVF